MTIKFMSLLDAADALEAYHAGRHYADIATAVATVIDAVRRLFPPGIKEGEAQIERGEKIPFAEAQKQAESQPTVKACPVCGNRVLVSCYHDGDDESSVEMPIADALLLRIDALAAHQNDVDAAMADIEDYCVQIIQHHLPPDKANAVAEAWKALNRGSR